MLQEALYVIVLPRLMDQIDIQKAGNCATIIYLALLSRYLQDFHRMSVSSEGQQVRACYWRREEQLCCNETPLTTT